MKGTLWRTISLAGYALLAWGCGSDDTATMEDSAVTAGEAATDEMSCPADTPDFSFGPQGLSAVNDAEGIRAYLVSASDVPPAHDFNDWTIAITDAAGTPVEAAQITWACAFMPLHGHGSNPRGIESLGGGQFELQRQNMAMYGGWEIRLWVDPTGAGEAYEGGSASGLSARACAEPGTDPTLTFHTCVPR